MDDNTLINLLSQVSVINKKYKEIFEKTGENFNIFNILRIEAEEVQTHSRFLCELLNPNGSHGKGELFLNLFLEDQKKDNSIENENFVEKLQNFNTNNCTVKPEVNIGFKNKEQTEGGRIDILIKESNSDKAIIIENKIFAGDQLNQLIRYNNAFPTFPNPPIFYLTLELDDNKPSIASKGDLKKGDHFKCISYKDDILIWLEKCLANSSDHPILKETIKQYIFLIKQLTNQTTNNKMEKEIVNIIIENEDFIRSIFEIQKYNIVSDIKRNLISKLKKQLIDLIEELTKQGYCLDLEFDEEKLGRDSNSSYITFKIRNSQKGFYISLGFCSFFENMFYAVDCNRDYKNICRAEVLKLLDNRDGGFSEIWIKWSDQKYRNWDNCLSTISNLH